MKAVQITKPHEMLLADLPEPQGCGAHEVKIRVKAAGICGSDIQIYRGTNPFAVYPRVIGHEFCGVVEETGEAVTRVKKGDHAAVDPVISCGNCRACRMGRHNVCEKLEVTGVHRDGGFCDYIVLPEKMCTVRIPPSRSISLPQRSRFPSARRSAGADRFRRGIPF